VGWPNKQDKLSEVKYRFVKDHVGNKIADFVTTGK